MSPHSIHTPLSLGLQANQLATVVPELTSRIEIALQIDQACTQHPCLTAFESHQDAVDRLWSWHVWQTHDEELDLPHTREGRASDALAEKQAPVLVKRVKAVRERWESMRRKVDQVCWYLSSGSGGCDTELCHGDVGRAHLSARQDVAVPGIPYSLPDLISTCCAG